MTVRKARVGIQKRRAMGSYLGLKTSCAIVEEYGTARILWWSCIQSKRVLSDSLIEKLLAKKQVAAVLVRIRTISHQLRNIALKKEMKV